MILHKSPAYSAIALAFFAPYSMGCQTTAVEEAPVSSQMFVSVSAPDGSVEEMSGSFEEMIGPSQGMLPEFVLDGELSIDAAGLLSGARAEFELADGGALVLERQGNSLARVSSELGYGGQEAAMVQWNDELDTMWITTAGGSSVIGIDGLEDESLRARYIGYVAAQTLGAHLTMSEPDAEVARAIPVVIALAALGIVGFSSCIFFGSNTCLNAALASCGAGNVRDFKVICGAGTDVSGKFQLGFDCSFVCK